MKTLSKSLSLSLFLAVFSYSVAFSQPSVSGDPVKLIDGSNTQFQAPVWSPDGSAIMFTSSGYQGLWTANAQGNNITQITTEDAGFGFQWSSDSKSVLTRVSQFQDRKRMQAIKIFHLEENREATQVTDFRNSMPSLPTWAQFEQKVVLISDNKVESFDSGLNVDSRQRVTSTEPMFYVLNQNSLAAGMIPENSVDNISPFEDATYLNLQVSPNGQKLAFEIYGGNMFVMNVDGSNLVDLGKANRPRWSPDGNYVIAQVAEDDGYDYQSSDLVVFSIDGNEQINLTSNSDLVAMNPSWSPDGQKIVFDEPKSGSIYVLNLIY